MPETETKPGQQTAAGGGRNSGNAIASTTDQASNLVGNTPVDTEGLFGKSTSLSNDDDVKGNLKIHIKLNLQVDIRIIAQIKGDIAIGIL